MKEALKYLQAGAIVPVDMETTILLVNALKEALAQSVQEPVKYKCTVIDDQHPQGIPLEQWGNTGKAQRTWVGLTDEEMQAVVDAQLLVSNINVYFKAIEAKLKEKNHG